MAHIETKDIHKNLRFVGSILRKIMPVFTKGQLVLLRTSEQDFFFAVNK